MEKGIVKFFNTEKGFGFICMENQPDIFVHLNDILDNPKILLDGQHVEFEIGVGARGPKAKNVKVVPLIEKENDGN